MLYRKTDELTVIVSFDHEKYIALLQFITVELLTLSSLNDDPFIFIRNGNLVPIPYRNGEKPG